MFDHYTRRLKDRFFIPLARLFVHWPPWLFSLLGLLVGVLAAGALARQWYAAGFALWFANRAFDGLDGAVARLAGRQSDLGGYLDIVFDFVVYALLPIGLALGRPSTPAYLSLIALLAVYYVNAATWMTLSALHEKRRQAASDRLTSFEMPGGIIGGTETILFYTLFIFFPVYLVPLFILLAVLVAVTALQRVVWAVRHL